MMAIIVLLEQLASNAHHRMSIDQLISMQSNEVQKAFITNDAASLKSQLGNIKNLADRCTVFQV